MILFTHIYSDVDIVWNSLREEIAKVIFELQAGNRDLKEVLDGVVVVNIPAAVKKDKVIVLEWVEGSINPRAATGVVRLLQEKFKGVTIKLKDF